MKDFIYFGKQGWQKSPNKLTFFLTFYPKWRTARGLINKMEL